MIVPMSPDMPPASLGPYSCPYLATIRILRQARTDGLPHFMDSVFFFGTLMHPSILARVLSHPCDNLTFQSAVLPGYVRHHLTGLDYPCIVPLAESEYIMGRNLSEEEGSVKGTLVTGLTKEDVLYLDVFEGDEYVQAEVEVTTLSKPRKIAEELRDFAGPHSVSKELDTATSKALVYQFKPELYHNVSPKIWDFDAFMTEKSHRWAGPPVSASNKTSSTDTPSHDGVDEDQYADVDGFRALNLGKSRTGPLNSQEVGWGGALTAKDVQASQKHDRAFQVEREEGPKFGHELLKYWQFDPNYLNLNHGSYGSPPRPVIEAMHALSRQCEANPDLFMRKSYLPLLNKLRKRLADLVNADVEDCVLVGNATVAVGTVLWNLDWQAGDVILGYSTTYNACAQSAKYVCDKNPGVSYEQIPLEFEPSHGSIYNSTLTHREILRRTEEWLIKFNGEGGLLINGKKPRVRMILMDAISSNPGLVMPWPEIVKLCKKYGALSLVDAAHEIGHLPIDLKASQPDFWLSNCHKWLFAHRGCCLLYVSKERQSLIRTSIPTSHFYESETYPSVVAKSMVSSAVGGLGPFAEQWEWVGTQDFTPFLATQAALDFRQFLGGEKRIMRELRALALAGGKAAAKILGTSLLENDAEEFTGCMVNILLEPITTSDKAVLGKQLKWWTGVQFEQQVFTAVYMFNKAWWTRMSAQVWLEVADFEKGAHTLVNLRQNFRDGYWNHDASLQVPTIPELS